MIYFCPLADSIPNFILIARDSLLKKIKKIQMRLHCEEDRHANLVAGQVHFKRGAKVKKLD